MMSFSLTRVSFHLADARTQVMSCTHRGKNSLSVVLHRKKLVDLGSWNTAEADLFGFVWKPVRVWKPTLTVMKYIGAYIG